MKFASPKLYCAGIALALLVAYTAVNSSHSAQNMESPKETVLAASTQPVELSANPVRVKLAGNNTSLDQMLESLPASRNIYLVITGLHAVKEPGTLFHLYLDLPEDGTPKR